MSDPFGRAILDHHRGERTEPLRQRDGPEIITHPIEEFYFATDTADDEALIAWVEGPLLDLGAGAGRHTRYFQERVETVAIERDPALVRTLRERGVDDAREADMFSLRDHFEPDQFRSAIALGTQIGLAGSMQGLRAFLDALGDVTTPDAMAVLDCYDPDRRGTRELLGFRDDPTEGLAYRIMQFEYEGNLGRPLLFRLVSPDRLRDACGETGWSVETVERNGETGHHYRAFLSSD